VASGESESVRGRKRGKSKSEKKERVARRESVRRAREEKMFKV
jgi:hypothetical protein